VSPTTEFAIFTRYNILPAINIYANVRGRDLASVAKEIQVIVDEAKPQLPRGSRIEMRGQVETMHESFTGLGIGLVGAIILVYLLIVINFQSWLDPFIVIAALIAALAGIAWMLMLTATNLSVPALTGAIMTKINWEEHVAAFRASSQSVVAYCAEVGIKPESLRYRIYKSKRHRRPKQFEAFQVATELVIARGSRGDLTLSGFDVTHLPQIVGAWSNALS
jgi:hypothetical protein